MAAGTGYRVLVNLLLGLGADANARASDGELTALQAAAKGGHGAIVDTLLKAGVDINASATKSIGSRVFQVAAREE